MIPKHLFCSSNTSLDEEEKEEESEKRRSVRGEKSGIETYLKKPNFKFSRLHLFSL